MKSGIRSWNSHKSYPIDYGLVGCRWALAYSIQNFVEYWLAGDVVNASSECRQIAIGLNQLQYAVERSHYS